MHAVEFTAELSGAETLVIPQEIAVQLPKAGRARIIVLTEEGDSDDDAAWDQQFEADVRAGRLDALADEAVDDLRAGRCTDL